MFFKGMLVCDHIIFVPKNAASHVEPEKRENGTQKKIEILKEKDPQCPGYESISEEMLMAMTQARDRASKCSGCLLSDQHSSRSLQEVGWSETAGTAKEEVRETRLSLEPNLNDYSTIVDAMEGGGVSGGGGGGGEGGIEESIFYSTVGTRGASGATRDAVTTRKSNEEHRKEVLEGEATAKREEGSNHEDGLPLYSVINKHGKAENSDLLSPNLADYSTIGDALKTHTTTGDTSKSNEESMKEPATEGALPLYSVINKHGKTENSDILSPSLADYSTVGDALNTYTSAAATHHEREGECEDMREEGAPPSIPPYTAEMNEIAETHAEGGEEGSREGVLPMNVKVDLAPLATADSTEVC